MKFPLAVLTALSATLSTPTAAQDTHAQYPSTTPPGANYTSPLGVEISNPSQSFEPNGPWSLMSRAGPTLYIAGMRGFSPANNTLVESGYPRVRQAFENMQQLANMAGTDLTSAVRLVVYVSDMYRWRPVVNQVQQEMWGRLNASGQVLFPPRTIVEVQRLNDDDIVEVEGTFWLG
ncbi:hypothetical protein MBLNU230_g7747t1 [Neophaeotheca triangularis]